MRNILVNFTLILTMMSCSNSPDMETGEIKSLQVLKQALEQSNNSQIFIDAKTLLSRKQIDSANTPVLFVKLRTGQNGTLTPYPGQGVGQTWLAADGATVTLDRGILKASRGMGDDLMGSSTTMPHWSKVADDIKTYSRGLSYITGNNKIFNRVFNCKIKKISKKEVIEIWQVNFEVTKFEENCTYNDFKIKNSYYIDDQEIVRKSTQYLSETVGYIVIERLDR